MTGPPAFPDDARIVAESAEQPELFATLYDRHAADIHRYAARRLGEQAADDITAETFLIAFRTRGRAPAAVGRLYRALATVPGVEITDRPVRDAAGREAIAVGLDRPGGRTRSEILIDPGGYGYLGARQVAAADHTVERPLMPGESKDDASGLHMRYRAGDVLYSTARTRAAVVDADGRTP